ncbi:hypothetical protein CPB85DRAFT_883261 [Mucidula mucida]|nr:hypothetical protein CPB85DRAFT_883261 [Mucidula mucida]
MLFSALSVLALSAITFASPAPLLHAVARGDGDKDHHWDDKDCVKGYLKLTTYDGEDYGYVGTKFAYYGAYTKASHDEEKLLVEIDESWDTWGPFDIKTLNGNPSNLYLSGIVGIESTSDDIGKGSYNYIYLGGAVAPTPPGSSPQTVDNTHSLLNNGVSRNVETAITKCFDVQWVNCDYSCPETFVGVYEEDNSFGLFGTGDKDAFKAKFGKATWVVCISSFARRVSTDCLIFRNSPLRRSTENDD